MKTNRLINRRNFLKLGVKAGGGALALTAIPIHLVAADEVSEGEPLAQAMGYKADASTVDTAKFPSALPKAATASSATTAPFTRAPPTTRRRPAASSRTARCRGAGWCNAWVAKS